MKPSQRVRELVVFIVLRIALSMPVYPKQRARAAVQNCCDGCRTSIIPLPAVLACTFGLQLAHADIHVTAHPGCWVSMAPAVFVIVLRPVSVP